MRGFLSSFYAIQPFSVITCLKVKMFALRRTKPKPYLQYLKTLDFAFWKQFSVLTSIYFGMMYFCASRCFKAIFKHFLKFDKHSQSVPRDKLTSPHFRSVTATCLWIIRLTWKMLVCAEISNRNTLNTFYKTNYKETLRFLYGLLWLTFNN